MQTLEPTLEALANRVTKLEAQNRRLKKVGIASVVIAAAVLAMGQAPAKKIIDANEFVLKDPSGKTRARLTMEVGRPTLDLLGAEGLPIVSIRGGDEPVLNLQRPGTVDQVQLGANKEFVGLAIFEKEIRAGLALQHGTAALDIFDKKGRPQLSLSGSQAADPTVGPGLTIRDPESNGFLSVGVEPGGTSEFSMYDSKVNRRVNLALADGEPSLQLEDKEGFSATFGTTDLIVPKTGRKESTSAASIALFGKDKKVLWSAP